MLMAPVTDPNNAHSTRKEMCLHLISEYQINSLKQNMITCLTMITFQLTVNFCKFYVLRIIDGALVSIYLKFIAVSKIQKGGSKVRVLGQGGACNSVPNGPNDLKFCMQGAFMCYY